MKNIMLKNTLAATLLLGAGFSGIASAHDIFNATLGTSAGAMDKYTVSCVNDPSEADTGPADRLQVLVRDQNAANGGTTNAASVRIVAFKVSGTAATNALPATMTSDTSETNNTYSSALNVNSATNGGNGDYEVFVSKSASGIEDYDVTIHCQTSAGVHTGTTEPVLAVDQ
jgi:hypothetical protein